MNQSLLFLVIFLLVFGSAWLKKNHYEVWEKLVAPFLVCMSILMVALGGFMVYSVWMMSRNLFFSVPETLLSAFLIAASIGAAAWVLLHQWKHWHHTHF